MIRLHLLVLTAFFLSFTPGLFSEGVMGKNLHEWYPFYVADLAPLPVPINMKHRVLEAPAGKHGYIHAVSDKLFFEDGTPARFWGIGITVSNSSTKDGFPPPKAYASSIAEKIASYGFNHVRISGFDGRADSAIKKWLASGKLESEQLDRLDFFIAELRKRGIYYSFNINNASHKLFEYSGVIEKNTAEKFQFRQYYNVRLFDENATDLMVKWIKVFFERRNPYTRFSYARDPANIYFTAVNEDTAFLATFSKGKRLDNRWRNKINHRFNEFLTEKYMTTERLEKNWSGLFYNGLLPTESLSKKTISLIPGVSSIALTDSRLRDVREFLRYIDESYYEKARRMLRSIGFKGLVTGTNKWYGYHNLFSNYVSGDFINQHSYFDGFVKPVKKANERDSEKGRNRLITIGNDDFITSLLYDKATFSNPRFALERILPTHLIDRPFIVSEWNHAIWSDYAFEGPYFLAAYASLNGIDGLDMHTMFDPRKPSFRDTYPRSLVTVSSNPLLTSILPTLSLAYLRGDIAELDSKTIYCVSDRIDRLDTLKVKPHVSDSLVELFSSNPLGSVRVAMMSGCRSDADKTPSNKLTSTLKIVPVENDSSYFSIISERYIALAGNLSKGGRAGFIEAKFSYPLAISIISLDGAPIDQAACSLLTVASSTKNSGMVSEYHDGLKVIKDIGHAPTLLRAHVGEISFSMLDNQNEYRLYSVSSSGELFAVDLAYATDKLTFYLDHQTTPWFLLSKGDCLSR